MSWQRYLLNYIYASIIPYKSKTPRNDARKGGEKVYSFVITYLQESRRYHFARVKFQITRARAFLSVLPPFFFFFSLVIISLSQRLFLSRRLVRWRHAAAASPPPSANLAIDKFSSGMESTNARALPRGWNYAENEPVFRAFHSRLNARRRGSFVRRGLSPSRPARRANSVSCGGRPPRIHAPFCPVVHRRLSLPSAPWKKELGRMSACRVSPRDWIARVAAHSASSRRGVNSKRRNLRSARPIIGLLILICARVTCNGWSARPPPPPPTRRQTERRARAENEEAAFPPRE